MTSLRKKVTSYFRQLSFHNEPRERKTNVNENSFITKYLTGQIKLKDGPPVLYGKNPNDLPNFELGAYSVGTESIVGCSTGPNGGLTTVKRIEKHLSITDPDIDFIDTQDESVEPKHKSPVLLRSNRPLDNSTMVIKVAGQSYQVSNRKSRSLGSLTDLTSAVEDGSSSNSIVANNNNEVSEPCKNANSSNCDEISSKGDSRPADKDAVNKNFSLSKSKSECNPFEHRKKGRIIRLTERPNAQGSQDGTQNLARNQDDSLPGQWNRKTDFVYGLSDSLYDMNQVTKCKNGNPIADCYGIIARDDSAILALADGVNWGEKACIAAKSAIHGCLDYLNKTIFDDTTLFEFANSSITSPTDNSPINTSFTPPPDLLRRKTDASPPDSPTRSNENRISNTTEVFISLLRAFNCAHNLILENQGMLTTLTVAVVLPLKPSNFKKPLKQENSSTSAHSASEAETKMSGVANIVGHDGKKPVIRAVKSSDYAKPSTETSQDRPSVNFSDKTNEKYICCVCNVGDTLAYVYSPKYGVRELTKGSHDVHSNRDMRDALGALGPVDGINPELNNLTLSVTTLNAGDIVMIASDGLTDNYDPSVCKYTANSIINEHHRHPRPSSHFNKEKSSAPQSTSSRDSRPPRERKPSISSRTKDPTPPRSSAPSNVARLATPSTSESTKLKSQPSQSDSASKNKENNLKTTKSSFDAVDNNPLIAQFMANNGFENKKSNLEPKNVDNKSSHSNKRTNIKPKRVNVGNVLSENKLNPLSKSSSASGVIKPKNIPNDSTSKYNFLRSKTSIDLHPPRPIIQRNEDGLPFVTPIQKYELTLLFIEDILKRGISGKERQCTTAKSLCENLLRYTVSITAAKRRTLEDVDLYFDNKNDILVEVSQKEKKIRRKRCLEKIQNLPGKLDHVSVVAYNVGNKTTDHVN